jgi:hypothetical protein
MSEASSRPTKVPSPPPAGPGVPLGRFEGAAFMGTGAALVVHILLDVPLWLSVVTTVGLAATVLVLAARRHPADHAGGRQVIGIGVLSATVALVAYDTTRLIVVEVFDHQVRPFDALPHFGAGLIGSSTPETAQWVAGALFHITNAVTFGIAYTVLAGQQPTRRRGVTAGVLFGLGLEAMMLGFYPAWLQIPNLREFISMSLAGHIAYGATLGLLAQIRLDRLARSRPRPGPLGTPSC